jgi:hypothetical protein
MTSLTSAFAIQVAPSVAPPLSVTGGSITIVEGLNGTGFDLEDPTTLNPSNGYIQTDQDFTVNVAWTLSGLFNPFLSATYTCTAYFELMGVNEVALDFPSTTPHVASALPQLYNVPIPVLAGKLKPGIYHVVVSLTTKATVLSSGANIGFPLVGFVDMGCIQIYES